MKQLKKDKLRWKNYVKLRHVYCNFLKNELVHHIKGWSTRKVLPSILHDNISMTDKTFHEHATTHVFAQSF